jgi:hypothetical protein
MTLCGTRTSIAYKDEIKSKRADEFQSLITPWIFSSTSVLLIKNICMYMMTPQRHDNVASDTRSFCVSKAGILLQCLFPIASEF